MCTVYGCKFQSGLSEARDTDAHHTSGRQWSMCAGVVRVSRTAKKMLALNKVSNHRR